MNDRFCQIRELPEDLQVLIIDYIEHSLEEIASETYNDYWFRLRRLSLSAFPRVKMWTDYRDRAYAEAMVGHELPPVILCGAHWLDGRHRVWALRRSGKKFVDCIDLAEIGVQIRHEQLGKIRNRSFKCAESS